MSVYIFLWGAVVVFGFIASRSNYKAKYFVLFSFFLMSIVLGLRGATVGEDTKMYLNIAERVTNHGKKGFLAFQRGSGDIFHMAA